MATSPDSVTYTTTPFGVLGVNQIPTGGVFAALAFGALPASFGAVTYNNDAACPNIAVGF